MNIEELDVLMTQVATKFNSLKAEEGMVNNRLGEIDSYLKQLQGEHAAYEKLKQSLLEKTPQEALSEASNLPDDDPVFLNPDQFKKKSKAEAVNAS